MNGTRASIERGLVAARRLAFAIVEVEQLQILHLLEIRRELGVELVENFLRARDHFAHFGERFQRRAVLRVHGQIPRAELFQLQLPLAVVLDFADGRHDFLFHRVVKLKTIFRRVIKPAFLPEGEIAVILKARIFRNLRAELDQLVENFLALVHVLQAALHHQLPRLLSQRAVWLFEITAHLHERFFFAAKIHRLRADQFLILLAQLRVLGFQRHVFRAEERRRGFSRRG